MKPEWILIANASHARLFRRDSAQDPLIPMETFDEPEGRQKASMLADDRLGHEAADGRYGGASFTPHLDPKRKKHLQFAHRLSERLDQGLNEGACDRISVFASCPFLGELKSQLSPKASKALRAAVEIDLTHYGLDELEARIAQQSHATP